MPVESPDIASLTLCVPLPLAARIYIGPWLVAYPIAAYAFYGAYETYIQSIGKSARPADPSGVWAVGRWLGGESGGWVIGAGS